jgi:hypothetical protein
MANISLVQTGFERNKLHPGLSAWSVKNDPLFHHVHHAFSSPIEVMVYSEMGKSSTTEAKSLLSHYF